MRLEINDALIRSLKPPTSGRIELRDTLVNGLVLRISANGTAAWSVRALTRNGKHTRPSLGVWPRVGVKAARDAARICLGEITAGRDPADEKRAAKRDRKARAAMPTVAARLEEWRNAKLAATAWSTRYASEIERLCTKFIVPKLGNLRLCETTRQDWTAMIAAHREERPASATWLYQLSSAFLNHAEAHGWIVAPLLPRKGLVHIAPKVKPRERILNSEELHNVWQASGALTQKPRCFVRLLILTGCRVSEAAGVVCREIDLTGRRWRIPEERAKNNTAITLPLCELALAELTAVWPAEAYGSNHLLGAIRGAALQGISQVKRRLDALSGIAEPWVMHDIRRTVRSTLSALGTSREVAEASLNHVGGRAGLVGVYDRHDFAREIIVAMSAWQRHVASLVNDDPPSGEVIRLHA
jgi:integrase